jgi:hypothetical protein
MLQKNNVAVEVIGTWGFPQETLEKIHDLLRLPYPDNTLFALLEPLKTGETWDALAVSRKLPRPTLTYRVTRLLFAHQWALDPMARFDTGNTSEMMAIFDGLSPSTVS